MYVFVCVRMCMWERIVCTHTCNKVSACLRVCVCVCVHVGGCNVCECVSECVFVSV